MSLKKESKKTGIFGGSFNPVHNGHVSLAKDAADFVGLDEVIFVPAYIQPFKIGFEVMSGGHRMAMLDCVCRKNRKFSVSDFELVSGGVSYTYLTMRAFREMQGNDTELCFISGTDSFLGIERWKNAQELLTSYSFAIGTRPGYREEELCKVVERVRKKFGTRVYMVENRKVDVSSTEVRECLECGGDVSDLIPEEVCEYILENGLYTSG